MEKWEKNFKEMMDSLNSSNRLIFENDDEMLCFIKKCEKIYLKTTKNHLVDFKEKEFEGNVDERRWYRFASFLQEKGYKF